MLVNLKNRSDEPELMDDLSLEEEPLRIALSDISRVNKMLGGNRITLNSIQELIESRPEQKEFIIVDIGCGEGIMLRQVADLLRQSDLKIKLIGVDLNQKSIDVGIERSELYPEISFINKDILDLTIDELFCDIIICTLTLHHFCDDQIKTILKHLSTLASIGLVINDLHRSKLAYYLFKLFSLFFIKSNIAKYDGLISIKRGFKKQELLNYTKELGSMKYRIRWKWAFRFQWILYSN